MQALLTGYLKKYRRYILSGTIVVLALVLLSPLFIYMAFSFDLKDKESIMNRGKTGLTLLDRDGEPFFGFYQPKHIEYVPISAISKNVQNALIAAEDKDFYTNPGFSIRGMIRAFYVNLTKGEITQGGSTITQGLVKNQLLSSERSFIRKFQEVVLATEISRRYSKNDILEMYLNSVYFGEGAFGIENAAETYFRTTSKDLTLSQSALLIGLLPAPSALSPLSNDARKALARQKIVLREMEESGFITKAQALGAQNVRITYSRAEENINTLAPHFALYVKNFLIKKYGEEAVIRRGMNVKTTLDSAAQKYAENSVRNQVSRLSGNNTSNGAAVALNPKNGEILVMVGSSDWYDDKFGKLNLAFLPRQPGSSFKPIIYASALEHRIISPATILKDQATTFPGNYKPRNYDHRTRGPVTVRRALANSLNIPAVQVMQLVGIKEGLSMAKRLGITTLGDDTSNYGLSLVLGTGEVRLLDLAGAYSAFANSGVYNRPQAILEIKDKYGRVIEKKANDSRNVLGADTSFLISSILSDNRARAETFGNALTLSRPAAVKTGTTENYRDAVTVGYTPSLVAATWVGNNDNSAMDNVAGSLGAAPIWRLIMEKMLAGTPVERFHQPSNVISFRVCPYQNSGSPLASSSSYPEFFIRGTQPGTASCRPAWLITPSISLLPTQGEETAPISFPADTPTPTPGSEVNNFPIIIPTQNATTAPPSITPITSPTSSGLINLTL